MKVKIGNKIFDAENEPIMIILTDKDKENICNMIPEATKYCQYPDIPQWTRDGYNPIMDWMICDLESDQPEIEQAGGVYEGNQTYLHGMAKPEIAQPIEPNGIVEGEKKYWYGMTLEGIPCGDSHRVKCPVCDGDLHIIINKGFDLQVIG